MKTLCMCAVLSSNPPLITDNMTLLPPLLYPNRHTMGVQGGVGVLCAQLKCGCVQELDPLQ